MRSLHRPVLATLAITILALGTVAPFAEAGHGNGRRYKHGTRVETRVVRYQPVYRSYGGYSYRRSSSVGPALAGFVGGLILGAVLTDHASGHVVYRDPYCDRDFDSRDAFYDHCNRYHHTREVHVVRYTDSRTYYDDCRDRGYYDGSYSRTWERESRRDPDYRNRDYRDYDDYDDEDDDN